MNRSVIPPLPHSGVARFVEGIVESSHDRVVCRARVSKESPFAIDGRVPTFVGLDIAAQAAAVLGAASASTAVESPAVRIGYLVGVRNLRLARGTFPAGEELTVTAHREVSNPPLLVVRSSLTWNGRELLSGTLSTYSKP